MEGSPQNGVECYASRGTVNVTPWAKTSRLETKGNYYREKAGIEFFYVCTCVYLMDSDTTVEFDNIDIIYHTGNSTKR